MTTSPAALVPSTTTASQSLAQGTRCAVPATRTIPSSAASEMATSHVPEVSGPVGTSSCAAVSSHAASRSHSAIGPGAAYSAAAESSAAASAIPAPLPPADTGVLRSVSPASARVSHSDSSNGSAC